MSKIYKHSYLLRKHRSKRNCLPVKAIFHPDVDLKEFLQIDHDLQNFICKSEENSPAMGK